jgi:hypothetical protein
MSIEQFNVQPLMPYGIIFTIAGIMVVIGIVLLVTNLLLRNRLKDRPTFGGKMGGIGIMGVNSKYGLTLLGIALIILSGFIGIVPVLTSSPSVITIGYGYVNVESKDFVRYGSILSVNDNKNVTSEEISAAFVGQVGSDDFKLHKESGTNFDDTNIGIYTLGNGAKAYVATTNSTCLIVELKNGEYLLMGTSDTQTLANSFSQNVYPLTTP